MAGPARPARGEIAEYAARFAAPHAGDAEDEQMWRERALYLE
jgi:hypothetical protein